MRLGGESLCQVGTQAVTGQTGTWAPWFSSLFIHHLVCTSGNNIFPGEEWDISQTDRNCKKKTFSSLNLSSKQNIFQLHVCLSNTYPRDFKFPLLCPVTARVLQAAWVLFFHPSLLSSPTESFIINLCSPGSPKNCPRPLKMSS